MAVLYITSDRPAAGKTALAGALAAGLSGAGKGVGYFKPFSASPQDDPDVAFVRGSVLSGEDDASQPATLPMPEGIADGQALPESSARDMAQSIEMMSAIRETVLVEGPDLSLPGSAMLTEDLDCAILPVVHYEPGLSVEHIIQACQPFGQRLLGVLINSVTRYREREVRQGLVSAIESRGVRCLGAIPEDRLMASVTVGQIARYLDGRWVLGQEKAHDLVENFLIGGNIMDSGLTYFGRMENKAVIVRGDRPDIQLAALSTPTTCLILTGGHEPIQYVYYQAEQEEVPLVVVQADTISTAHALDAVLEGSTIHHSDKLERFRELTEEYVDVAAIQAI